MKKQPLSQSQKTISNVVNMEFSTYGNKVQAVYMRFKKDKIAKSKVIGKHSEAVIDMNENGDVVGIEMTQPGTLTLKRMIKKLPLPQITDKIFESANCAFA